MIPKRCYIRVVRVHLLCLAHYAVNVCIVRLPCCV